MKKCIVISDSFKGTLSSAMICDIARESFLTILPNCRLVCVPVADGGEGTVDCFAEVCAGTKVAVPVKDPYGKEIEAAYLRLDSGEAVIEMASSAGLPLVGEKKDPCRTSTYGVGQQIRHAVEHGCKQIVLGLGGSATNDGGCGCAAALGVRFLDAEGKAFVPVGGTLGQIADIDLTEAQKLLSGVKLTVMCDIENPLYGPNGAAYVYAPQKGADTATVAFLDTQLKQFASVVEKKLGKFAAEVPGAGAAGGFGYGMLTLFDAVLQPGIETVLDLVRFDELLQGCDLVITGEGRLDSQSLQGKVLCGVGKRAKAAGVPLIAIVGGVQEQLEDVCDRNAGISAVFSINRQAMALAESKNRSRENYRATLENLLRTIQLAEQF